MNTIVRPEIRRPKSESRKSRHPATTRSDFGFRNSFGFRPSGFGIRNTLALCFCALAAASLWPNTAAACAACYGQSDSSLAKGMNWGIVSLLVVVVGVLSGITTFFVYVSRRSSSAPPPPEPKP